VKAIVTTTIYPPTEALRKFSAMEGWTLFVAGDKKTPIDWYVEGAQYITPEEQHKFDPELSQVIGWNCMQRRNFATLYAHHAGAEVVAIVDDDNIPYEWWGKDLMVGREVTVNYHVTNLPAFDPVGATNYPHLWHRGYPLELLPKRSYVFGKTRKLTPDVQADFWNGNPDIDAVCRMEHSPECVFNDKPFPMAGSAMSPFNSQNTFIAGNKLKDYFLCPGIGRMDDIWAAYYLQAKGATVVYGKASVYQQRNVHNLVEDMRNEYLGYEHNLEIVKALPEDPKALFQFLPGRAIRALELYQRHFQ
jgi:hypothetical protein